MQKPIALALSTALVAAAAGNALAQDVRSLVMTPGKGVSFYMGAKHGVVHFQPENGACKMIVAMGDQPDAEGMSAGASSRIVMSVVPGLPARIDTTEGQSLSFACAPGALAMRLDMPVGFKFTEK